MPVSDDEIDRLYQLPLSEFTAARDELAKRAGARSKEIKSLQKPNAAAWAVNQLYWRRRKVFDRLIKASERLRAAHAHRVAGKRADVAMAEDVHRAALSAAVADARELLTGSGDGASPATMTAVGETLQTLPSTTTPGRLTRPLKPLGFGALAALLEPGNKAAKRLAEVVPFESRKRPAPPVSAAERVKREAHARRRDIADVQRQLKRARETERKAGTALSQAQAALHRALGERAKAEAALEKAAARVQQLREQVSAETKRSREAAAESGRLTERLADLQTGRS
jgi:hypothetical protein